MHIVKCSLVFLRWLNFSHYIFHTVTGAQKLCISTWKSTYDKTYESHWLKTLLSLPWPKSVWLLPWQQSDRLTTCSNLWLKSSFCQRIHLNRLPDFKVLLSWRSAVLFIYRLVQRRLTDFWLSRRNRWSFWSARCSYGQHSLCLKTFWFRLLAVQNTKTATAKSKGKNTSMNHDLQAASKVLLKVSFTASSRSSEYVWKITEQRSLTQTKTIPKSFEKYTCFWLSVKLK